MNLFPGKLAAKHDLRTLQVQNYLKALPPPPSFIAPPSAPWLMGGNDKAGDCVVVHCANTQVGDGFATKQYRTITDQACLDTYSKLTGYNPVTGANDTGLVILDFLNQWRRGGFFSNVLGAYASIKDDVTLLKQCIELFGGISIGIELPIAWQGYTTWNVPQMTWLEKLFHIQSEDSIWQPGSWGGHCIFGCGYDDKYLYAISWKEVVSISWAAVSMYCSEFFALFDSLWIADSGRTPNGIDAKTLQLDLEQL